MRLMRLCLMSLMIDANSAGPSWMWVLLGNGGPDQRLCHTSFGAGIVDSLFAAVARPAAALGERQHAWHCNCATKAYGRSV